MAGLADTAVAAAGISDNYDARSVKDLANNVCCCFFIPLIVASGE